MQTRKEKMTANRTAYFKAVEILNNDPNLSIKKACAEANIKPHIFTYYKNDPRASLRTKSSTTAMEIINPVVEKREYKKPTAKNANEKCFLIAGTPTAIRTILDGML